MLATRACIPQVRAPLMRFLRASTAYSLEWSCGLLQQLHRDEGTRQLDLSLPVWSLIVVPRSNMTFERKFRILLLGTGVPFLVLIAFAIGGFLGTRGFGAGCFAVMGFWALVFPRLRPRRQDGTLENSATDRGIHNAGPRPYARILAVVILLTFGLWFGRGGPWIPQVIGATVLIAFLIGPLLGRKLSPDKHPDTSRELSGGSKKP